MKKNPTQREPPKAVKTQPGRQTDGLGRANANPSARLAGAWPRFRLLLATSVSGASLAAFRIALGLVMSLEACALCRPNRAAISSGTTPLETYYTGPDITFSFPYEGFEWLPLLPAQWIDALVAALAFSGVTMALGLFYRASAITVFLTWGYLFAVESTRTYWQSHFYLEALLAFLMIWMPAARRYSIDACVARGRNSSVPCWPLLLLRGQLVIAYFYAGVAKLNADWLLDAVPVRWFLADPAVTAPYEKYLGHAQLEVARGILHSVPFAYFISYAGVIFDLSVGFLLLIRRTRIFAMILMVLFHATNHFVIFDDIGWFPLVGVTTALIFFDADWLERCWRWVRRPRLTRPDWGWFAAGAIFFPLIGASLGWKSKPGEFPEKEKARHDLAPWTAVFVVAWLVWQALLPLRHYLIPGDGRFTYEGLGFSWRLKTDVHRALGHKLFLNDPAIIAPDQAGHTRVHWNEWHGDKVIYRSVTPGRINWPSLPEIVVLREPILGERILYNPFAGSNTIRTEAESRERVRSIWQELYGRQPQVVGRTAPLFQVLDAVSGALSAAGHSQESAKLAGLVSRTRQFEHNPLGAQEASQVLGDVLALLHELQSRDEKGALIPFLRPMDPFALEGERRRPVPFLVIEDAQLIDASRKPLWQIDRRVWKNAQYTRDQRGILDVHVGDEPLVICTGGIGAEAKYTLPQACLFDSQDHPERPPYIWWNSLKDLTSSKFTHISNQAFYLRRYARRVAWLWEKEYGRRPMVTAWTAVSLNGRPHQPLVDPEADLASVPATWFGHNPWIRDLETPRIPREALARTPAY